TRDDTLSDPAVDEQSSELEIATISSDTLRANIRVMGPLTPSAAPLLTSVLRTHVSSGRRYVRVDLATARVDDDRVIASLVSAHRTIADLGGMLVFENAGPQIIDALRAEALFVRPAL
ncbi:MAG: hypothetical protein INR67_21180, partial [Jatrophihabitans endophyticus]